MPFESDSTIPFADIPSAVPSRTPFILQASAYDVGQLRVLSFRGREATSEPFRFDIHIAVDKARHADVESELLGQPASLIMLVAHGDPRVVRGIVALVEARGAFQQDQYAFRVRIVPRLWLLGKRKTSRIFQNKTVPEIVDAVLAAAGVARRWSLVGTYAPRTYCVQYQETDLAFVSRLLSEAGIFYFFEHGVSGAEDASETVVFGDSAHRYDPIAGDAQLAYRYNDGSDGLSSEDSHIHRFVVRRGIEPGSVLQRDYDFRRPMLDLRADAKLDVALSETGAEVGRALPAEVTDCRVYEHHGEDDHPDVTGGTARVRLEQQRRRAWVAQGASACRRLLPGARFELVDHGIDRLNRSYAIARVDHEGHAYEVAQDRKQAYANTFVAVPVEVALRPKQRRRALQQVVETARVVGPEGEEIYTDDLGRVKVQFPWDLDGKWNEHSSCWVRVAQAWAGSGWGHQFIPRIGMEVVVTFVGGDVDRPLITGCVPNAVNGPPFPLPGEKTRSGLRTRSSPGGRGFNELSFEDKAGAEVVHLRAERDMDEKIHNNHTVRIGHNQRVSIGANLDEQIQMDHSTTVFGNRRETIQGETSSSAALGRTASVGTHDMRHVGGNDFVIVAGNAIRQVNGTVTDHVQRSYTQTVRGHHDLQIGAHDAPKHGTVYASGNYRIIAGREAVVRAERSITLTCGESSICISPDGITLKAASITLEGSKIAVKGDGPELRVSDRTEIISDKIHLQAKDAAIDLERDAKIDGTFVKLNCGPDRIKPDDDSDEDPDHAIIRVFQHMAGTPCERMKVTLANAKGETREYVTGPDGTIRVEFDPEEKSGALRIVSMCHADNEDQVIHLTDVGRG